MKNIDRLIEAYEQEIKKHEQIAKESVALFLVSYARKYKVDKQILFCLKMFKKDIASGVGASDLHRNQMHVLVKICAIGEPKIMTEALAIAIQEVFG